MGDDNPVIFRDNGKMEVNASLAFFQLTRIKLEGAIVRLEAQRGTPEVVYNTRFYSNENEEIWLSGLTCGKQHAGALGLCETIAMLGWDKYVSRKEILRIVLNNNSFRMEFRERDPKTKKIVILNGASQ